MKTIANLINFNKALVNEAKDPNTDMNPGFKKAVLEAGPINRAGTPARKAENLTIAKMGNMNAVPFQNAAQINAAGMMGMQPTPTDPLGGMNQVVQGGIPGTLPGSGNVPGVNQVPPTNRNEDKPKKEVVYQTKSVGEKPTERRNNAQELEGKKAGGPEQPKNTTYMSMLPEVEITSS